MTSDAEKRLRLRRAAFLELKLAALVAFFIPFSWFCVLRDGFSQQPTITFCGDLTCVAAALICAMLAGRAVFLLVTSRTHRSGGGAMNEHANILSERLPLFSGHA